MKQERLLKIIQSVHVSEKSTRGTEANNQYTFHVIKDAVKSEISDAVEFIFGAKVKQVRIVNVVSKKKTFKNIEGKRSAWKKAYVTLLADQKLDIVHA